MARSVWQMLAHRTCLSGWEGGKAQRRPRLRLPIGTLKDAMNSSNLETQRGRGAGAPYPLPDLEVIEVFPVDSQARG